MNRVYLAADHGQPESEVVRRARERARQLAWADPLLRAHEGRSARSVLESAAASVAAWVGSPGASVAFYPGAAAAFHAALAGLPGAAGRRRPAATTGAAPVAAGAADTAGAAPVAAGAAPVAVGAAPVAAGAASVAVGAADRLALRAAAGDRPLLIPVDGSGRLDPTAADRAVVAGTPVVATSVGNHEVGTMQPVAELAELCHRAGSLLVLDATMSAGRAQVPSGWDVLVLDASSWAGGSGVAAVVVRPGVPWQQPPAAGGPPQLPWLSPAVADCAAAAIGLESACAGLDSRAGQDRALTERLRAALAELPDVQVHGDPVDRLPHVVSFSALYVDAEALLLSLDRAGIAVASGSACAAESGQPSHVLAAMGALTSGNVRVNLPIGADSADVDALLAALPAAIADLRAEAGL